MAESGRTHTAPDGGLAEAARDQGVFDAAPDLMFTVGPDGLITDANAAALEATGRCREDLVGSEFSAQFADPDRARAAHEQALRKGRVPGCSLGLRPRAGRVMPVTCDAISYRDPAGRVRGVLVIVRDITRFRAAEAALRGSEERLRAIFDAAPVGIDDVTPGGEIVRANARFCELTGYSAAELRSKRLADIVHPDDRATDEAATRRLLSGATDSWRMVKRFVRKDGRIAWAEVTRAVVRDQAGAPLLLVGVVRDLTAQRKAEARVGALTGELEARVRQRTEQLAEANRNLEAFTYSVSHDLRAPLRALSGFSEALIEDYGDRLEGDARRYAERIRAASEQLSHLIDDLLKLSRLSRAEMKLQPVDLSAEVTAILADLHARDPGRQVTCDVQGGVVASADHNLIRVVLQNLLENAWKFTARREDARIEFGARAASGTGTCYFVRDNGAGFDPAAAGKLFQPLERLHAASEFPGSGIGLASVRRIIERHGGTVRGEGSPGAGAEFCFTLPGGEDR